MTTFSSQPNPPAHLLSASAPAPPPPEAPPAAASLAGPREEGPFRVLLVCTANHCRSPLAEAMLRKRLAALGLASQVEVQSAALRQVKVGCAPSPSMSAVAARRGLDLCKKATWASPERLDAADLVVCMDHEQAEEIARDRAILEGGSSQGSSTDRRVRLLLEFAPECGRDEVPDPHGLHAVVHERVADLIEQGVEGLAAAIVAWRDRRE